VKIFDRPARQPFIKLIVFYCILLITHLPVTNIKNAINMYDQDRYTKGKRVNIKSALRKEQQKIKRLQKEQERLARAPSCRLGKVEKKQTARTNIILDEQIENIRPSTATEKPVQKRVVLSKQKRKQGHRPNKTYIEQIDCIEGEHPIQSEDSYYDDGFWWGRYMAELSDQAHKERRQREKALTGLIVEDPTLRSYEIIIELQNWG
jgi:hypothetical protein